MTLSFQQPRIRSMKAAMKGKPYWRGVYRGLQILYHLLIGGQARSVELLRLRRPSGLFQPFPTTMPNRYPMAFQYIRDQIGDGVGRRILSFGCASGEEVFSLQRHFPAARILGVDINSHNIKICLRRWRHAGSNPHVRFIVGNSAEGLQRFDVIFAMAVFRHDELRDAPGRCDHCIRFVEFSRCVDSLAAALKPGGYLVIAHSNYLFSDTSTSAAFRRVQTLLGPKAKHLPPIYGPDDRLLPDVEPENAVYQKMAYG